MNILQKNEKRGTQQLQFQDCTVQLVLVVSNFQNPLKLFGRVAQMKRFLSATYKLQCHWNYNRNRVLCSAETKTKLFFAMGWEKKTGTTHKEKKHKPTVNYVYGFVIRGFFFICWSRALVKLAHNLIFYCLNIRCEAISGSFCKITMPSGQPNY